MAERIHVYNFTHEVVKNCSIEFDGVYEEGDELTPREREWIESDDGVVSVFSMLNRLKFTEEFPYEYVTSKSFTGRKGYKHNYHVIKRKSDNKYFEYHTTSSRNNYEEFVTGLNLVETKPVVTTVWDFESSALSRD